MRIVLWSTTFIGGVVLAAAAFFHADIVAKE